jgi:chemotaxis protein histidine kinase CheA
MTNPLGAADFFALEAGECLDRLETLIDSPATPSGEELLRLSRVLRGSALMAGQTQIARAAAGLEGLARAHRDHRRTWDAATREHVAQAVEEFRLLIRRAREWNDADTARVTRLGRTLETLTGSSPAEPVPHQIEGLRPELHTGVRAFVAREGALIASALDRAARAVRVTPGDREPLYNVIRRMQSLRGLAELGELSPLPEILDGIELAVGDLTRLFAPPPGVDEVMDAAAQALTRISRDVAESGRPDAEAPEAGRFTELLLRAFAVERDVVPIESLYFAGDTEPLTQPASQPQFASPEPLGPLELVSHGEHLSQSADLIAGAKSPIQRDLRLYHLLGALRSAAAPSADPVAGALGILARSAQEALAAGIASHSVEGLVARLREAGELLRAVVEADDRMLISRRLLDVAHRLDRLRGDIKPERPAEPPLPDEPVPIESLAYDSDSEVVPIESLAPDAPVAAPAAAAVPATAAPAGGPGAAEAVSGLETSFQTYDRLVRGQASRPPSLDALLGKASPTPQPETREAPAPPAAASTREAEPEELAVAIDSLCYRGHAALERAVVVRHQIAAQLERDASLASLQPLLQELLDLVPLALAES